ncbi:MAG: MarR family transcriptional regulator [Bifidobacterium sp.]|jgi:DNA-binding MarR family transcriptional regulator
MAYTDDSPVAQPQGWRTVAALNSYVERGAETALREAAGISLVEYTLLDVMHRQSGRHHLRMSQVARATALSESATTRLVDRLESRGMLARYLCADDRRGIYAELTPAGMTTLERCQSPYAHAITDALSHAASMPEFATAVNALQPVLSGHDGEENTTTPETSSTPNKERHS